MAADAALAHADGLGIAIAVAVVDDTGAPLVLIRVSRAQPSVAELALDKAYTAAVTGAPSEGFGRHMLSQPNLALGLANRPRLLPWGGGIPIVIDGQLVGAIGVSGSIEADDIACAEAGIAGLA
ncbi:GlcG/HbpS family heme-binding protein [Kaistia dalseonensis]